MVPPDLAKLEVIHEALNKKLASWEKKKLANLLGSFRQAETEINAMLASAADWEQFRLEHLLTDVGRSIGRLQYAGEKWVKGRADVPPESPLASLAHYPASAGGGAAAATVGITASVSVIHMPVLVYLQDYQLDLIKNVTGDVLDQIRSELKRGYIMGDSIPDLVKRLRDTKLDKGVWPSAERRAEVVARTEILRASNQGALYVYRQYDVRRVKWLTAADERVCPVCGPLHGQLFLIDEIPFGGPPGHPRCRCFIAAHIVTEAEAGRLADEEAAENYGAWRERQDKKKSA